MVFVSEICIVAKAILKKLLNLPAGSQGIHYNRR
jgi:hypothetical protein